MALLPDDDVCGKPPEEIADAILAVVKTTYPISPGEHIQKNFNVQDAVIVLKKWSGGQWKVYWNAEKIACGENDLRRGLSERLKDQKKDTSSAADLLFTFLRGQLRLRHWKKRPHSKTMLTRVSSTARSIRYAMKSNTQKQNIVLLFCQPLPPKKTRSVARQKRLLS